jgi:hypothetical protein
MTTSFNSSAPSAPPSGITGNVLILRKTDVGNTSLTDAKAVFSPGTAINAADLNKNQTQVLRAILDLRDTNMSLHGRSWAYDASTPFLESQETRLYSDLNMTGRNIKNIGTAVDDKAAVNREMLGDVIFADITSDPTQGVVLNKTAGGTNSGDQMVITAENSSPTQKGTVIITPDGSVNVVYSNGTATIGVDKSTPLQQGVVTVTSTTPIEVDNTVDGEVVLSLSDNTIDLAKLKASQIVTSIEQENNAIATVGAIAKRNDLIYQNSPPLGLDFAVGRLWYDHDNHRKLNAWDGSKWETIIKQGGEILETPATILENRVVSPDTNALLMGPVAVGTGIELTVGLNSQLTVHY